MAVKTETVAIRVSPEEKQKLQEMAAQMDMTISKMLHNIIFDKEN